jgi:hypothetical protein
MVVPSLVCVVREGRWSRDFRVVFPVGWMVFPGRPRPAVTRVCRIGLAPRVDGMIVVWQWARHGRVCVTRETIE